MARNERSDQQIAVSAGPSKRRLDSWKAIANYLRRTVRTAHRWEKEEGLPVHRHLHHSQSTVYAFTDEIDAWWEARKAVPSKPERARKARMRVFAAVIIVVVALGMYLTFLNGKPERIPELDDSIAVLPFTSLDEDANDRLLGSAVAEELLNELARIESLTVIARTSSFGFAEPGTDPANAAAQLGVEYVITGNLQTDANVVRVHARLVNANGQQVWGRSFDRPRRDLFELQQDIARTVVDSVAPQLSSLPAIRAQPHPDAYEYYLIGRENIYVGDLHAAEAALRQALAIQEDFSSAYGALAWTLALRSGRIMERVHYEEARDAARRALQSDPNSPTAHLALGILAFETGDYEAAADALRLSLANDLRFVDARFWLGRSLQALGEPEAARDEFEQALVLSPVHPLVNREVAHLDWAGGDFATARARLSRILDLPRPPQATFADLVALCLEFGRFEQALDWARQAALVYPRFVGLGSLIRVNERLGMFDEADDWLELLALAEQGKPRLGIWSEHFYIRGNIDAAVSLKDDYVAASGTSIRDLPAVVRETLGGMLIMAGDYEQGVAVMQPLFGADFDLASNLGETYFALSFAQMLVHAYLGMDKANDAEALLARIDHHLDTLDEAGLAGRPNLDLVRARQAALRGEQGSALRHLNTALDKGWRDVAFERQHPAWKHLPRDQRIRAAFQRVDEEIAELRQELREEGSDATFRDTVRALLIRPG